MVYYTLTCGTVARPKWYFHLVQVQRRSNSGCPMYPQQPLGQILQAKENTAASKLVALKSLGHWVGDIHQPLHVSFLDDKGGNTIRTSAQCPGNLHAVWDTCLVQYAIGPDTSEAVDDLLAAITPEMKVEWNASVPRDWANESFAITEAARTMYCVMSRGGRPSSPKCTGS